MELAHHGTGASASAARAPCRVSRTSLSTLAVLMHGASRAFFINGQVVRVEYESGVSFGRVGIFADGLQESVRFSQFAVYPPTKRTRPMS